MCGICLLRLFCEFPWLVLINILIYHISKSHDFTNRSSEFALLIGCCNGVGFAI